MITRLTIYVGTGTAYYRVVQYKFLGIPLLILKQEIFSPEINALADRGLDPIDRTPIKPA